MAIATAPGADDILAEGCMTILECQRFTGLSRTSLYAAMYGGELVSVRVPGQRARRIPVRAAKEFLRRGLTGKLVVGEE